MKAIKTTYLAPTNTLGPRIKATTEDHNVITLDWNDAIDAEKNHKAAAVALCKKFKWNGRLAFGSFPDCYVFVFINLNDTVSLEKV